MDLYIRKKSLFKALTGLASILMTTCETSFKLHEIIHDICLSTLFGMGISFRMKAFHKLFITVTSGVSSPKTKVMFVAAGVHIINRCSWTAAARSTPFIAWKNTERKRFSSTTHIFHLLFIKI